MHANIQCKLLIQKSLDAWLILIPTVFLQPDFPQQCATNTQMGRNLYKNARLGPIALGVQT